MTETNTEREWDAILFFLVALPMAIVGGILLIVTNELDFFWLMVASFVLSIILPILHDSEMFKRRKRR